MSGNPACDCWEKGLWYLCCGDTEWCLIIAEAERETVVCDDRTHFSEMMFHPVSSLKPDWMDDVAARLRAG